MKNRDHLHFHGRGLRALHTRIVANIAELPPAKPSPVNTPQEELVINFSLFVRTTLRRLRCSRSQPRCKRREHRSVANFELLKDVMEVHFDSAINNVQSPSYFLVRQPLGH